MRSVDKLSLEGIANTLFLHYMDIERLDKKPDLATCLETVIILYHELVSVRGLHHHLIMHALKDGGGYRTRQHRRLRRLEDVNILGAQHDIYRHLLPESLIHALELMTGERDLPILDHRSVQAVTLTDEISDKRIDRLVINIDRGTDLLDLSLAHDNDRVAQRQRFLLVVGHVHERNA